MNAAPAPDDFEAAGESAAGSVFRCGLCGLRFTHGGRVCGACPLGSACDLVRCPGCGYQFPRGSRTVEWLRGWWRALARRRPGVPPARAIPETAGGDARSVAATAQGGSGGSARAIVAAVPSARAIPPR
jgi:hypothetical protein